MRKYLEREYGSQRIYQRGLRVYTTLDPGMQRQAVRALRKGAPDAGPSRPRTLSMLIVYSLAGRTALPQWPEDDDA